MSKKKSKNDYSPAVQAALAINKLDLRFKLDWEERVRLNKVIQDELQKQIEKENKNA